MTTPGTISGTNAFNLANGMVVTEAFDRIGRKSSTIDRHQIITARTSINLLLVEWANKGVNLWKVVSGTINLVAGQTTYTLPATLIDLTEVWYTTVDLTGGANSSDRFMSPMDRTEYAMIPNKQSPGSANRYWYRRTTIPQVTMWPVPPVGAPGYVINWLGLSQIDDVGVGGGETPDAPYRALDALCAGLAVRLAEKFAPERLAEKVTRSEEAWDLFHANDQESGMMTIRPDISTYGAF